MDLSLFKDKVDFYDALKSLFESLNVPVNCIDEKSIAPESILTKTYKETNEAFLLMEDVYVLGMVDDNAFAGSASDTLDSVKNRSQDYDGILIFGVTLKDRDKGLLPTRTQLAEISRAFNREYPHAPVVVVCRYGDYIAIANSERAAYKQQWREGEKVGKVALLRDINIDKPHTGHLKILQELTITRSGKGAVNSFAELYAYWQSVFNVSILNKQFYKELSDWYFWAMREVYFPDAPLQANFGADGLKDPEVREHNAKNLIRLLTRILFVWFVKEKKLIPEELFDEAHIKTELLKNFEPKKKKKFDYKTHGSMYYRAILQNLFFATLNQDMGKREFRKSGQHMNITNLMRYETYFKAPDKFIHLVEKAVPFMNGGLFECLDKPIEGKKGRRGGDIINYIDGFSDKKENELIVPDYIFFGTEDHVNLSEEYGQGKSKNKDVSVKGLIDILNSYKFTIDENTPIEQDIALDPELLGRVFENLLASYNPETKTTARKQTGSFYTPREIVNYMVDESLIAHLKNSLADSFEVAKELDEKLHQLLSYDDIQPFDDEGVKEAIIKAIDKCKILDPACGSGAFPMGALQKMVHIIQKIDPMNKRWKERQYEKAQAIDDGTIRDSLIADIEEAFENNELDYGRKLYLIENCIYGVDIQPIAVQISKLRFFISLIVDQKVNKKKKNFGVRPLPNLETKFVAANTLIGLKKPEEPLFDREEVQKLENELKDIRHRLFSAKTPTTKRNLRKEDKNIREQITKKLEETGWGNETARQLADWDPYDQNASSPFFDAEWMFDIADGFDVVIGNPPYVDSETMVKNDSEYRDKLKSIYRAAQGNWDIFVVFIEKGILLTKMNGNTTYIVPNKFISAKYTTGLRTLLCKYQIQEIVDYSSVNVFEEADVYPVVFRICNTNRRLNVNTKLMSDLHNTKVNLSIASNIFYSDIFWDKYFFDQHVVESIVEISTNNPLTSYDFEILGAATVSEAYQIKEHIRELNASLKDYYKLINTGTIDPFRNFWGVKKTKYIKGTYERPVISKSNLKKISPKRLEQSDSAKIIVAGMSLRIEAFYDAGGFLAGKSTSIILGNKKKLMALNAILNSTIISFWFSKNYNSLSMAGGYFNVGTNEIGSLPIPEKAFGEYLDIFCRLNCIIETSLDSNAMTSCFIEVLNFSCAELYFSDHMKSRNIDILQFVKKDLKEVLQNKDFDQLTDNQKEKIINQLYTRWTEPQNKITQRIKIFCTKSSDILKQIIKG